LREKSTLLKNLYVNMKQDALQTVAEDQLFAPTPTNFLQVIADAARDPNVDVQKMHGLLDIQERMMNKQAEMSFTAALTALQGELPRITQDAEIRHSGRLIAKYAKYETIDAAIRPLLIQNGFSLRYNTRNDDGKVIVTGTLSHKDGHSITDEIPLAIDTGGAKNSVQAVGSTISYGKRYLVGMLLNLVFEGEDDDGKAAGYAPISEEQAAEIKRKLMETDADVKKFLELVNAKSVDEISVDKYALAMIALNRKAEKSQ